MLVVTLATACSSVGRSNEEDRARADAVGADAALRAEIPGLRLAGDPLVVRATSDGAFNHAGTVLQWWSPTDTSVDLFVARDQVVAEFRRAGWQVVDTSRRDAVGIRKTFSVPGFDDLSVTGHVSADFDTTRVSVDLSIRSSRA